MDFLNKAFAQVSDLFKSMTPGARMTAGLLLAVVVVSLGYLLRYQVSGADEYLNGAEPLTRSELMLAEAAFGEAGLNDYEVNGYRIRVPKSKRAEYQKALADAGILLEPNAFDTKIAADDSPWRSKGKNKEIAIIARQNKISAIIEKMSDIEHASVIYSETTKPGFRKEKEKTATVSVTALGARPLDVKLVPTLRALVSGSFGMKAENVKIIDIGGGLSYSGNGSGGMGPTGDTYGSTKRMYEQDWEKKILHALAYVDGVQVSVNAELIPFVEQVEKSHKLDKGGTTIASEERTFSSTNTAPGTSGRPGFEPQRGGANTPGSVVSATGNQTNQKESSDVKQITRPSGETDLLTRHHGMTPKRVAVSVAVPTTYFERIWQNENPPAEGEEPKKPTTIELQPIITAETKKIKEHVAQLIPLPDLKAELTKLVTVSPFVPKTPEAIVEPGVTDHAIDWLGTNWSTLGMTGLAFFSLFMLRSMVRSGVGEGPAHMPARQERRDDESDESEEDVPPELRLKRFGESGPSLREELSDLVREDPDAAAKILRGWIGSGA